MKQLQLSDVEKMSYVQLLASTHEINRPPGGKDSIRKIVQNTFLHNTSTVLDVGCNTGFSVFEIAHLVGAKVTGVDISSEMIDTANLLKEKDSYRDHMTFAVADGMKLPFEDESFDLTMSGGSTAFISDKLQAISEYARVTKKWGFIADVNFYYKEEPPADLLEKLNTSMGISIEPWKQEYWLDLYSKTGLELYYSHHADVYVPSQSEIESYCAYMSNQVDATAEARTLIQKRFVELMTLFTENHRYLAYGVFIMRKRDFAEQRALFGA